MSMSASDRLATVSYPCRITVEPVPAGLLVSMYQIGQNTPDNTSECKDQDEVAAVLKSWKVQQ